MPVEWKYATECLRLGGPGVEDATGIAEMDARRQAVTAEAILDHLRTQPGMILADEVGMGKTYVALAVVASVLSSTKKSADPVVVMVPPGLLGKWRREWQRFKVKCTVGGAFAWMDRRDKIATTPTEFFKLLDDPPNQRARLIFLKTSCFAQGLVDPWIKLALVRYARTHTKMTDEERKRIHKWAGDLTLQKGKHLSAELIRHLMKSDPIEWKARLVAEGVLDEDDDPVPAHLDRCKDKLDYSDLIAVLRNEIPGRSGALSKATLKNARRSFNDACQGLYWQWLQHVKWKASLLVLDEAHHAKNDSTQLAGLFRSDDLTALVEGRADAARPDLWEKADRMLFLTATPFQLGHDELIRVLRSFAAVRWTDDGAPSKSPEEFLKALETLKARLNENRLAGRRLDALWGRMSLDGDGNGASDLSTQWVNGDVAEPPASLVVEEVKKAVAECRRSKLAAERDAVEPWNGLYHWVVRHNRPTNLPKLPSEPNGSSILRRVSRTGTSILDGAEVPASCEGLTIEGSAALPFLLSARAQAELAMASTRARAFFAEGLSSSYEAFHHTRDERVDVRDDAPTDAETAEPSEVVVPLEWYEDHIAELIPQKTKIAACYEHPKIRAVVERAVDLWLSGEKVLIFAFYSQTVKALRDHLRREADRRLAELAATRLGMPPEQAEEAHEAVLRVARRFADPDSPFQKGLEAILNAELADYPSLRQRHDDIYKALATYVRTPAFITRFMPLDDPAFRQAIEFRETRPDVIQVGIEAFKSSFASRVDGSGMSMHERIHKFLAFAKELAAESNLMTTDLDEDSVSPLDEYLDAVLGRVQEDDEDETGRQARGSRAFGVVRAVLGETDRGVRERLMLAFNSPLFPELLVSSGVLGEGVDLHRFCRHLIHHDLCWNPSSLEQRTGRLDRIHCKAEVARRPIIVYLPFIAGSADEKMFRVVKDRERWFQVVMGQEFKLDERTTETLASRVPLPPEIAAELIFDLTRWNA